MKKNTRHDLDLNGELLTVQIEEREDILDNIRVCEEYLFDAAEAAGTGIAHLFPVYAQEDARRQIAFERSRLAELDGGLS